MYPTLEERVEDLEKKLAEFTSQSGNNKGRGWQQTFGLSRKDEGFEELVRLGKEYRTKLGKTDGRAGS